MQINEIVKHVIETNMSPSGLKQEGPRSPTPQGERLNEAPSPSITEARLPDQTKELDEMVGFIQEELEKLNVRLVFNVDEKTKDIVVEIVDPKTNEVIRQIPPEELLKVREKLDELVGILFEARA